MIINIGQDESNNGRKNEIHVAVFSSNPLDIIESDVKLPKRRSHGDIVKSLGRRKYRFVSVRKEDKIRIPKRQLLGAISASLLDGEIESPDLQRLQIYIDGEKFSTERLYARDMIADVLDIGKSVVSLFCGARFDQRYPIVNLADRVAHYTYYGSKRSYSDFVNHRNRKPLII